MKRLRLQNFQGHHRLDVQLDQPITTIVGASDRGKSAVLRALRLLCLNQPGGTACVRHGAKAAAVRLEVDDTTITRVKGTGTNTYSRDGQEYKAFGAGVPDPVADVLNVAAENFQQQHDAPYWFSDTAGQVARNLNAVVDLEVMDTALADLQARARKVARRVEVLDEQHTEAVGTLAGLDWVEGAVAAYASADAAQSQADALEEEVVWLRDKVQRAREAVAAEKSAAAVAVAADKVASKAHKARQAAEAAEALRVAVQAAQDAEARLQALQARKDGHDEWRWAAETAAHEEREAAALRVAVVVAQRAIEAAVAAEHLSIEAHADFNEMLERGCPVCGK